MRKILKRTITGIIYVALLVMATTCGAGYFVGVFGLLLILGIIELSNLCNKDIKSYKLLTTLDVLGGVSLFASTFLSLYNSDWNVPFIIAYLPYVIVRLISQLYIKDSNSIRLLSTSFLSQVIVALPLTLLNYTYFVYGTNTTVLACLIFIWMNDTGAYCVGSMIGNRRLFERISPKKSWEGFFGGLFFTIVSGIVVGVYFPHYFTGLNLHEWIGLSAVVTAFATWGDLIESLIKRNVGAKDSSHILPGHGGILDRIDSLLLVSPAILLYLYIIQL